ncbi:Magnesium transporter MgtE [Pseudobythopirellula maris]|uniref:Magnesium transporter MgtE n=1 Tax=Pseudobythopirellula maris TaxID=2527991 RepID=A0A5C5ZT72_9BACT|nr:magnesium transporter [Pseudobythopirellula maris]TWT90011.1 Magnesium transporter MgtE [Pseudobythopirellula maris]
MLLNTLYLPELREMIASDDREGLRDFCGALHPARVAEFMEGLDAQESWRVLLAADPELQTELFGYLDPQKQTEVVHNVAEAGDQQAISRLVVDMPADDRVDLLYRVDNSVVDELLPLFPRDDRHETLRLLEFPEGTAGSKMTTEVAKLSEKLTVREALEEIAHQSEDLETIFYLYVVDEGGRLQGLVSARQLVVHFRKPDTPIAELMQRDVVTVRANDDQEAVAEKVAAYDFLAIPVVDDERKLLGIITHDDIIDVLRAEATEDAHLAVGVAPLEGGYLDTHWFTLAWKRGMWLAILFFAALLTALALRNYEGDFQKAAWLVLFIPLVISSGGNSGSQSATLVIRGLTDGDVRLGDWRRVLKRELVMGLCLGTTLATAGYFCAVLLTRSALPEGADAVAIAAESPPPTMGEVLVVPITLLLVVLCGTLSGGVLPLVFQRLGLDPALMSNALVAGIIDIAGIIIYMTVAVWMVSGLG